MKRLLFGPLFTSALLVCWSPAAHSQAYTFRTPIGTATSPGTADGTNATAQFNSPTGLALSPSGSLWVVDGNALREIIFPGTNWVVRTRMGVIGLHTFVDGTNGAARFNYPQSAAVDQAGSLYIADTYNNAIRRAALIGTNWVVTTLAGPVPPSTLSGTADGTNNNARFKNPYGIAVDAATNLYVADSLNHTVRKVSPLGADWVVSTLAGAAGTNGSANGTNSAALFNTPVGVAVDAAGSLYVADLNNNTLRKLTRYGTNWAVTTLAGASGPGGSADGLGPAAAFKYPQSIAVDAAQNLFVTDSGNNTIRKVTPAGLVTTVAGAAGALGWANGTGSAVQFNEPYGIAVDAAGALYVSDFLGYAIRQGNIALLQARVSGGQLVLSWPSGLTGFFPESCSALPAVAWTPVPTTGLVLSGTSCILNTDLGGPGRFFRLHQPAP